MGLFQRIFQRAEPRDALIPLYNALVAEARQPDWYQAGAVPDTVDGRFDMVALVLSLVLFRMEALGDSAAESSALLTEVFVADMDGQLRQLGIDYTVGKHIGKMVAALGGRLSAYRDVRGDDAALGAALVRNLYRGVVPADEALAFVVARMRALDARISALSFEALRAGQLG